MIDNNISNIDYSIKKIINLLVEAFAKDQRKKCYFRIIEGEKSSSIYVSCEFKGNNNLYLPLYDFDINININQEEVYLSRTELAKKTQEESVCYDEYFLSDDKNSHYNYSFPLNKDYTTAELDAELEHVKEMLEEGFNIIEEDCRKEEVNK